MLARLASRVFPILALTLAGCSAPDLAVPASEPGAPVAFRASSFDNDFFAFVGEFEGTYVVKPDGLDVFIRRATVQLRDKGFNERARHLYSLRLGLGYGSTATRWGMRTRSEPVRIDRVMNAGEEVTLDSLHVFIPAGQSRDDVRGSWIIFEMEETRSGPGAPPGGKSWAYAHSPRLDGSGRRP